MSSRGIVSAAGYVPFRRLQRSEVAKTFGSGGGRGTRSVASYDEDTTTMGVEAARFAMRSVPGAAPGAVWFATADPAYLDKTNAAAIHAALRLDGAAPAFDLGGALRSGVGALRIALDGPGTTLVVSSDIRTGLPTGPDESAGGDGAAAVLVGDGDAVIAEYLGVGAATDEFVDRWRTPGDRRSKVWEERFGETKYLPLGEQAWQAALTAASLTPADVTSVAVAGLHGRAVKSLAGRLGVDETARVDDLAGSVGGTGTAHPMLLLASMLEAASPGDVLALVALADGADVLLFRRDRCAGPVPSDPPRLGSGGDRRRPALREVPVLARHGHRRTAAATGAGAGVRVRGRPVRGLEVRLRRIAGHGHRRALVAAVADRGVGAGTDG